MSVILTCADITVKYDASVSPAVQNTSFEVESGDYLCVVGENGSGKSTLIKCLLGLTKPLSGNLVYNGVKPTEIGYLSQQTIVQKDFPAAVYEIVLSGCLNKRGIPPFYTKSDRNTADEYLRLLKIETLRKRTYRDLSGGQQQRVLLARALCATTKLLILDEPVSGLDPDGTYEMYDLLKEINGTRGITIVMVTHDIKNAVKYGNKILHMRVSPLYFGSAAGYADTDIGKRMLGGDADV